MEIKKYIITLVVSFLLSNQVTNYNVTLYGVPMANVEISFKDTDYNNLNVVTLNFETKTTTMMTQIFEVDNKYETIIKKNNFDIISFKKITYQPNVTNQIKTILENENVIYEGTNIIIPKQHFNIFSLLYYLSNTSFEDIESIVDLEREGLHYKCIINKKRIKDFYEIELEFRLLPEQNQTPVFENSDIFTWALFRDGARNKVTIDPSLNQIQKCIFSLGFSNLEAEIKKPLNN